MDLQPADPDCVKCHGDGTVFIADPTQPGIGYLAVCFCRVTFTAPRLTLGDDIAARHGRIGRQ